MPKLPRPTLLAALLLTAFTAPLAAEELPDTMTTAAAPKGPAWEPAWGFWPDVPKAWQQTHWGFVKQASKGGYDVVFLGDSITKGWQGAGKATWEAEYVPLKSLDLGIGGDTTRQTVWRIQHEALDGLAPKVIVLMIGVNNIFTQTGSDEDIVKAVGEILKLSQEKCPGAQFLLLGILPLGNEAQDARAAHINTLLPPLVEGKGRFLDLRTGFEDAEGKIIPELYNADKVHLAAPGYVKWNELMKPTLLEMLK
jgi:lysophospholipase L1-like esterase